MDDSVSKVSKLREVGARFDDPAQMREAINKLCLSGFDRADLGLLRGAVR